MIHDVVVLLCTHYKQPTFIFLNRGTEIIILLCVLYLGCMNKIKIVFYYGKFDVLNLMWCASVNYELHNKTESIRLLLVYWVIVGNKIQC